MSDSAYTILIAEDDDSIRHALTDVLTASGYEVLALEEGLAAIHAVRERNFDLALLDVAMPGADGFQVLQAMSEERPGTPVIMLTARGEEEDRVQGLKLGADDYMTKPSDEESAADDVIGQATFIQQRAVHRQAKELPLGIAHQGCRILEWVHSFNVAAYDLLHSCETIDLLHTAGLLRFYN